jgi:hypothetical protein
MSPDVKHLEDEIEHLELELSLALARNTITRKWFVAACRLLRSQRQELGLRLAFIAALIVILLLMMSACTSARRAPWIIEQPLHYAPPEPAPAGPPPLPPKRPRQSS